MTYCMNNCRRFLSLLLCSKPVLFIFILLVQGFFFQPVHSQVIPPNGPGGPVLVIGSSSDPFARYSAEMLRAEGMNEFSVLNLGSVNSTVLASYDVVVLGRQSLTTTQVTMFTNWVNNGGVLIAIRPDKRLAGLLGVTDAAATLSNRYLLIQTASGPGKGLVNETIQFHGTADLYNLNGATALATFYSTATTATTNPAVTWRNVGSNGGKAIGFLYDLNRSVVFTRQGNPAWAGDDRDGDGRVRSNDLFFGPKVGDVQPSWVDFSKIQIPQADEQQRLLANIIIRANEHKKPLPRFWYLPSDHQAAVVISGDNHGGTGTGEFFNYLRSVSPSNTAQAVQNWQAIRGTSNVYPNHPMSNSVASSFQAQGFEISLHLNTNCAGFTSTSVQTSLQTQLAAFRAAYPGLTPPSTCRIHCGMWSSWSGLASAEQQNGIRLSKDYYYFPAPWVQNRPGLFTGSGLPMRYTTSTGTLIDNYQVPTQITDESGQDITLHINTLLNNATGSNGYYGVFCVNIHTDNFFKTEVDKIVAAAQSRNVPLISSKQLLTWLDGRNASSFSSFSWAGNQLGFTINAATGSANMRAMLPRFTGTGGTLSLQSVSRNGSPVRVIYRTIKGVEYALFDGLAGSYTAVYAVNNCAAPTGTISVVSTTACPGSPVSLQLNSASGTAPYTLVVNGKTYENVTTGVPFATVVPGEVSLWNAPPVLATHNVTDGNQPVELGLKFRSNVAGYVTGVQFYKSDLSTGAHVGKLYASNGTLLATVSFSGTNDNSFGWRQARFSQPVLIQPNTTYVVSYFSPSGYFSYTDFFFNTNFVNGPLTALQDGVDGLNGLGGYGSGFPTSSFQSRNYWVDVLFTPVSVTQSSFVLTTLTENNGCTTTAPNISTATPPSCGPLPVELLSFTATARQQDVFLKWKTGSEQENKGFVIQRSTDTRNWFAVGFVKGAGNSAVTLQYAFVDKGLAPGKYFYRLVQQDFDGTEKNSPVEQIVISGGLLFELKQNYPNPFRNQTTVEFVLPQQGRATLALFDLNGKRVQTLLDETRGKGVHIVTLHTQKLTSGIYYLRLESGGSNAVRKIIIQ